ncbi:MAG: hypothetical protein Alpg2KO_30530 [Alphaproteobacteria bacterium]
MSLFGKLGRLIGKKQVEEPTGTNRLVGKLGLDDGDRMEQLAAKDKIKPEANFIDLDEDGRPRRLARQRRRDRTRKTYAYNMPGEDKSAETPVAPSGPALIGGIAIPATITPDLFQLCQDVAKSAGKGPEDESVPLNAAFEEAQALVLALNSAIDLEDTDTNAMLLLGHMHRRGFGVTMDELLMLKLVWKAASMANTVAEYYLGRVFELGLADQPEDEIQAMLWYEKAAAGENVRAEFRLGEMFRDGIGTRPDFDTAQLWFKKAAAHGEPEAQYMVGCWYLEGKGFMRDMSQAGTWLSRSAEAGQIDAQALLGQLHLDGRLGAVDHYTAQDYLTRAAQSGHIDAAAALGEMLADPENEDYFDKAAATRWLARAAQAGHEKAAAKLREIPGGMAALSALDAPAETSADTATEAPPEQADAADSADDELSIFKDGTASDGTEDANPDIANDARDEPTQVHAISGSSEEQVQIENVQSALAELIEFHVEQGERKLANGTDRAIGETILKATEASAVALDKVTVGNSVPRYIMSALDELETAKLEFLTNEGDAGGEGSAVFIEIEQELSDLFQAHRAGQTAAQ